jgi:BASS family bile acid:Na+ symporter
MTSLLAAIGRKAPLALVIGVIVGLFVPELDGLIEPALPVLVIMLLAMAMVRVDLQEVLAHLRNPLRMGLVLLFLMVMLPLLIHGIAILLDLTPSLHLALVLMMCAPPLTATPSLAALLGLDDAMALNILVVGTLIVPLSAPALAVTLLNLPINLDAASLFMRLVLATGLALFGAFVIRRGMGPRRIAAHTEALDGISALIMVAFAIVVMNGIGLSTIQQPWRVANVLGVVLLANWGLQALTSIAFMSSRAAAKKHPSGLSRQGGAIALMAGNRNIALFFAAVPLETVEPLLLFLALYQIPIYLSPMLAAPLYRRVVNSSI